jgi:O-antigen/teichoic acid export membrane protein
MNQGLILLSPLVLVRLLSVEQFGQYREFLLYVTVLGAFGSLGFSNSLLYFIPADPGAGRQLLRQTATMTFVASVAVVGLALLADVVAGGSVLGTYRWPVLLYVLCFVNVDFWEFYWLARRRPMSALFYATGRLAMRMAVVIASAALTSDVNTIIWSVVAFEAVRLVTSALLWRRHVRDEPNDLPSSWREQLRYCLPLAGASVLVMFNKSLGNLAVAKFMGAAALAQYTIGTQIQPVVTVLRNSISDSLLPEMAGTRRDVEDPLALWRRTTVVSMLLLVPVGIVLVEFARPLVTTLFTADYTAAVPIFQLYVLVLLREVFDFGVPLRAANRTAPVAHSNLLAVVLTVVLLAALMPTFGLLGAVSAFLISRYADGLYLAYHTCHQYRISIGGLADWRDLAKVACACAVGSLVFVGSFWTDHFGLAGVVIGAVVFLGAVGALLIAMQLPELSRLIQGLKGAPSALRSMR